MSLVLQEINAENHTFILTNQRALYWPLENALILSDLHLGKTAHFRKNGIALPTLLIQKDLDRLSILIKHFSAKKIYVVGDFLHAGRNSEFQIFKDWKILFPNLEITLIKGNHDRVTSSSLYELGIANIYTSLLIKDVLLSHEEVAEERIFTISGHIHPGIELKLPNRKSIKLPCFIVKKNGIILPAFSSFTGLDTNSVISQADFYAFSNDGIYKF